MEDFQLFVNELLLPAGYMKTAKEIKTNLQKLHYQKIMQEYSDEKNRIMNTNEPITLNTDADLTSQEFLIQNTTFFSQAKYFGDIAKNSTPETKPLLFYYAEISLYAFFIYSLFTYPTPSKSHGLTVDWKSNLKDTKVKILKKGFFSRIVDCYSILECETHFSILTYDTSSKKLGETKYQHSLLNEPSLTLEELIKLRESLGNDANGHYYDVIDFILIFFASSMARYKPYFWHKIIKGQEGTEFAWFTKAFDRFDLLWIRLMKTLLKLRSGMNASELQYIDPIKM